jgi:putative colanic acid biosynthesis UDP-glucose lipid carrier transferase
MDTATKEKIRESDLMLARKPHSVLFYPVAYRDKTSYLLPKRAFDIFVSSVLIVTVLSWLYPLLAILINMSSKGGTLFVQKRIGLNGKEFRCFKFRTMVLNKESEWKDAVLNDERITKIGKWLRATYIDELPQMVNVLIGDMSIIGPRPHMIYHHRKFCSEVPLYDCRHWIKPGITGLSQVKGYHGRISGQYHIYGRTKLDLFYVRKVSFKLDMMILFKTAAIIFSFNKISKR